MCGRINTETQNTETISTRREKERIFLGVREIRNALFFSTFASRFISIRDDKRFVSRNLLCYYFVCIFVSYSIYKRNNSLFHMFICRLPRDL